MTAVWMVEVGEYSDRDVLGPYSTECNARLVAEYIGNSSYFPAEMDECIPELICGWKVFGVHVNLDGSKAQVSKLSVPLTEEVTLYRLVNNPPYLTGHLWAANRAQAFAKLEIYRQEYLKNPPEAT